MYEERATDGEKPAVRWLPFQLNPDLPAEGISRQEYIERKFGPGGGRKYDHVAQVGKSVGIDFAFDNIKVQPNTVQAHRLMHFATKLGAEDAVAESIFAAYFIEGKNLTDTDMLADIGARGGLFAGELVHPSFAPIAYCKSLATPVVARARSPRLPAAPPPWEPACRSEHRCGR